MRESRIDERAWARDLFGRRLRYAMCSLTGEKYGVPDRHPVNRTMGMLSVISATSTTYVIHLPTTARMRLRVKYVLVN